VKAKGFYELLNQEAGGALSHSPLSFINAYFLDGQLITLAMDPTAGFCGSYSSSSSSSYFLFTDATIDNGFFLLSS